MLQSSLPHYFQYEIYRAHLLSKSDLLLQRKRFFIPSDPRVYFISTRQRSVGRKLEQLVFCLPFLFQHELHCESFNPRLSCMFWMAHYAALFTAYETENMPFETSIKRADSGFLHSFDSMEMRG